MRSREEAVKKIEYLLGDYDKPKGSQHHFGRQELRNLMDFIYSDTPFWPEEFIKASEYHHKL